MEQSLERPLAPPYQGLLDLMRATIRTVNKQGGESPEEGSAATEAELVTLEEDTLFSSRPTILFESEVFRIDRRNTTINRILAKLDHIPRIDIAGEIRGLPSAPGPAEYAVIKFPGQLRMSTFCAICRGVFSAKECKGASVVQHPNCACRGLQIYGRRCIGEALRRYKLCPACRGNLKDNISVETQIREVLRQECDKIIPIRRDEQQKLLLRRQQLLQLIENIEEVADAGAREKKACEEAAEVLHETVIEASISAAFNSQDYFATFVSLLLIHKTQLLRAVEIYEAWLVGSENDDSEDEAYDNATIVIVALLEIQNHCTDALGLIQKTEISRAAVQVLEEVHRRADPDRIPRSIRFRDLTKNPVYIINDDFHQSVAAEAEGPSSLLYWSQDATTSSGFSDKFNYIHLKTLRELESYATSRIFNTDPQWTATEAITAGLTFGCAVDFLLQTPNLTPSLIDKLQAWSENIIRSVALLYHETRPDLPVEPPPRAALFQKFKELYYGIQMDFILRFQRGDIRVAEKLGRMVWKILWVPDADDLGIEDPKPMTQLTESRQPVNRGLLPRNQQSVLRRMLSRDRRELDFDTTTSWVFGGYRSRDRQEDGDVERLADHQVDG